MRHDGVDDVLVLEENREARVVPAGDRRLADRIMTAGRLAEFGGDAVHGHAAAWRLDPGIAHGDTLVHVDDLGRREAGQGSGRDGGSQDAELHDESSRIDDAGLYQSLIGQGTFSGKSLI